MLCPHCEEEIALDDVIEHLDLVSMSMILQRYLDHFFPLDIFPMKIKDVPISKRDPGVQAVVKLREALKVFNHEPLEDQPEEA